VTSHDLGRDFSRLGTCEFSRLGTFDFSLLGTFDFSQLCTCYFSRLGTCDFSGLGSVHDFELADFCTHRGKQEWGEIEAESGRRIEAFTEFYSHLLRRFWKNFQIFLKSKNAGNYLKGAPKRFFENFKKIRM
jgi:hypothetical protein